MAVNRDTFLSFGELLEELSENCRRAVTVLQRREQRESDMHGELVAWVRDRQQYLLKGLVALAEEGPEELLQRRLQYKPDYDLHNLPEDDDLLPWVINVNNQALTVLRDQADKTLAPETEESIDDLVTQLDGLNRRIALALNTAQDL